MSSRIIRGSAAQYAPAAIWPGDSRPGVGEDNPFAAPYARGTAPEPSPEPARAAAGEKEQARASGYREGEAAGRALAEAGQRDAVERLARTVAELASLKPRLRAQAETEVVRLAVAIARRVLHRELSVDPQAIQGLIQAALASLEAGELSRVRVHPEHEAQARVVLSAAGREKGVEVVGDASLDRGGAVFETARGSLDASVETQLAEIERGLTDRLRRLPVTPETALDLEPHFRRLGSIQAMRRSGVVEGLVGLIIESRGPAAGMGDFCEVQASGGRAVRTQVIGFRDGNVLSMPLEETGGLRLGDTIVARSDAARVEVGEGLLGRVLDGFARPMDDGPPIEASAFYDLYRTPPSPLERAHITQPLETGIRAIDSLLPCGAGQRVGIFGGSGVGKSTLLAAMARNHAADVTVIAMIGERNREVRAFLELELGEAARRRAVVVTATSDRPAPLRVRACFVALAVAEYFRDQGAKVLLVVDSITRLAMAQREIGLAAGEPPSQKGYTPSVFHLLPQVFERAGNFARGSITGFFTVLVEGDDFNEPICDAVRGLLDGHIVLSRRMADAGRYPAIDILQSVSRLTSRVAAPEQQEAARKIREALSIYQQSEDLIQLGAYAAGSNPKLDASIAARGRLIEFLRQDAHVAAPRADTLAQLNALAAALA